MDEFISGLNNKRPDYTTEEREHDLVITLDGIHNVSLNKRMIHEAKLFDAYNRLIELIDHEMEKLVNNYKNGTK